MMILCSAIRIYITATDQIVTMCGFRHHDIIAQLPALGFKPYDGYKILKQGFINDRGQFLDREEAFEEAVEAGQIISGNESGVLFSEDLY